MDKKLYDKDSIESLSPLEFTRLRPGVYAGDCTYATQLLVEIVSNAIDEFNLGHGNVIDVVIDGPKVSVRDYGQGFLINEVRDDGKTVLEAAFSVLNTSGKYREDGTYEGTSLGSFGIGSKITNFLSHNMLVKTMRNNKFEAITFNEGVFEKRELGDEVAQSGTYVEWTASEEFFTHPEIEMSKIKDLFKTLVCLCKGLKITLNGTEYYSENGINDLVDVIVKDKEILENRCKVNYSKGKNKIDFIMTYTDDYGSKIIPYVNTGLTEKGPHITGIKALITREFNKFFREKKWIKDKEENLSGDDIQEGMNVIFNITAPNIGYDAQVKSTITKIDMTPFTVTLGEEIRKWLVINEKDAKLLADKALSARRAREAARKARDAARGASPKKNKFLNLPTKLVDANSKDRRLCELYIVEGDSAAGGLVTGRESAEYQAIFPIRGKILNTLKASIDKVFANQEINNLVRALGLELDKKSNYLIFDENKIRYGKIILTCDADPDGEAIINLLLTAIWSLCPELILKGYVYIAFPPLFRITTKKNEYVFLKGAKELEEYKESHKGEKFQINRNKGLGEQDAEELAQCLLDEETRNIELVKMNDVKSTDELFDILMGPNVPPRRAFLLAHAEEAND